MIQKLTPQRYELFSGNTGVFNVTVLDQDSVAQDITGASARFTVSRRAGDANPLIDLGVGTGIAITDATNGLVTITVPAADTEPLSGAYRWELEITDVAGRVATVAYGSITFITNTA
jgi:hypothetical protein